MINIRILKRLLECCRPTIGLYRYSYSTSNTSPLQTKTSSLRSLLYVPGSDIKKLRKAILNSSSQPDALILDLEDSVALTEKGRARNLVFDALQASESNTATKFVRVNSGTGLEDDLEVVLKSSKLEGIVIPKVESAADVLRVEELIEKHGLKDHSDLRIIASIESPLALLNLREIATSSKRLAALLFASEDYCNTSNLIRTKSRLEMLYARSSIVTAAKAFGLQAIDMVCINYSDNEVLKLESQEGRELGFDGKQAIHPNQVLTIQTSFSPSEKEILKAVAILEQYKISEKKGKGAYGLKDGTETIMIDAPMVLQAEAILRKSRAAGIGIPKSSI